VRSGYVPDVTLRRLALPLALLALLVGLPSTLAPTTADAAPPTSGQATYVPLEPVRLLDTRAGGVRLGAGGTLDLAVVDGVRVPADATAVVLNVTATGASAGTDIRVYPKPAGGSPPLVNSLSVARGATAANLVHVGIGQDGSVRLHNAAGAVHLVADLSGFFVNGGAGASYVGAPPRRLLDTRTTGAPLAAGEVRTLQVRGSEPGAPADATAVVLNVTAVGATAQTDVRVWPTRPGPPPTVSNLNPPPGRETPAAVVVAVGADGTVSLRSSAGSVHLVVDLSGWYLPSPGGDVVASAYRAMAPTRLLDTRATTALGPGEARTLTVAGAGTVPAPGTAVVLTVTGSGATGPTNVRVYPRVVGGGVPTVSNLNLGAGQTVANTVLAQVGADGQVVLRNASGRVHLAVDLAGWFTPAGNGWDISWPQCTPAGGTASRLPTGGAFAVIGLTRGTPFTDNPCFATQWSWADALPGEPMVYLNVSAPGVRDGRAPGNQVWQEVCGTGTPTTACGLAYGERISAYAVPRLPTVSRHGGRPMVWLDIEGPYANGPFWQTGYEGAVAVNRAVIQGVVNGLRRSRYRIGIYSDRGSVPNPNNDWRNIVGDWRLTHLQNWVFRSPDADPRTVCGPVHSFSGGPVVMAQVQPATSPGAVYDVNGLC
jgi:hypothetical protein